MWCVCFAVVIQLAIQNMAPDPSHDPETPPPKQLAAYQDTPCYVAQVHHIVNQRTAIKNGRTLRKSN